MSECRFYDSRAVDRALRPAQQRALRGISPRARTLLVRLHDGDPLAPAALCRHCRGRAASSAAAPRKAGALRAVGAGWTGRRTPKAYDAAAALLDDLRELARRQDGSAGFRQRVAALRDRHAAKPRMLGRFAPLMWRAAWAGGRSTTANARRAR